MKGLHMWLLKVRFLACLQLGIVPINFPSIWAINDHQHFNSA